MNERLQRLREELGPLGLAAIFLFAFAGIAWFAAVQPLERKHGALEAALEAREARAGQTAAAGKLEQLYRYLERDQETTDWLAKLHAIGRATGVQTRSATYRSASAGGLERYEIVLPVAGSYQQIRAFMKRALAEIPVLSLDQVSLKRERRTDGVVQAELRLALHRVQKRAEK